MKKLGDTVKIVWGWECPHCHAKASGITQVKLDSPNISGLEWDNDLETFVLPDSELEKWKLELSKPGFCECERGT